MFFFSFFFALPSFLDIVVGLPAAAYVSKAPLRLRLLVSVRSDTSQFPLHAFQQDFTGKFLTGMAVDDRSIVRQIVLDLYGCCLRNPSKMLLFVYQVNPSAQLYPVQS